MNRKKIRNWSPLDNAAKIFPPTRDEAGPKVFRFSCCLTERVEEPPLQRALAQTLEEFPSFRNVLKRGVFWYYLEENSIRPLVKKEDMPPCSLIYRAASPALFRVTWFEHKISLEVYHVLTDGTGAMQFFKLLLCYYLKERHPEALQGYTPLIDYSASRGEKGRDSFDQYYNRRIKGKNAPDKPAYQLRGPGSPEGRLQVIEGLVPADRLLQAAHRRHATLTVFLTAVLMQAVEGVMRVRDKKKPVTITVPVNLRNFFESQSARNFFSIINVAYSFQGREPDLDEIVQSVGMDFKQRLTQEFLQNRLNALSSLEHNPIARVVPLPVKDFFMKAAYNISERNYTAALSNIGRVDMPAEVQPYISYFDVLTSTKKLQLCICSYQNVLALSFSSAFAGTDVQRLFFQQLTALGIPVEICSNIEGIPPEEAPNP